MGVRAASVAWCVSSLERIPPHLICPRTRAQLVARARAGEELRAWSEWTPPCSVGVWYLWDGSWGRRVVLGLEYMGER